MRFVPLALILVATALVAADNPFLGTWKMNPAKSKSSPTPVMKEMTVTYEMDGEKVRRSVTGIDGEGNPMKQSASVAWDGKDHETQGPDGSTSTINIKRVDDRHYDVTVKQKGEVMMKIRSVVSQDGTTMTNTIDGVNPKGEKVHRVDVFEKQ
jgi:hypothetical protein